MSATESIAGIMALVWIASWFAAIWAFIFLGPLIAAGFVLTGLFALVNSWLASAASKKESEDE